MILLFQSPAFSLTYNTDCLWLAANWSGLQDADTSLANCALILQFTAELQCTKLLCDSSQALDGWDEIGQWVSTQYLPRLAAAGINAIAWINARDWHTRKVIEDFIQNSTRPFIVTFDEGATAYEWLRRFLYVAPPKP